MIGTISRRNQSNSKSNGYGYVLGAVVMITALFFSGCGAHTYGKLSMNNEVKKEFQNGQVNPEYNYYYTGRENFPYAIAGIDKRYKVPSKYWIRFDPDTGKLKEMSGMLYEDFRDIPYGAIILAPGGNRIGIWYSNVSRASVRVDEENQTVDLLLVNPETSRGA